MAPRHGSPRPSLGRGEKRIPPSLGVRGRKGHRAATPRDSQSPGMAIPGRWPSLGFVIFSLWIACLTDAVHIDWDMIAWNGWYHCMGHTYGSWLRGDERGWRARHHREHVEGDYLNPPPAEAFASQRRLSRALMKRPAVVLTAAQRVAACAALGEKLLALEVELVELCVGATHFHLLARFPRLQSPGIADLQSPGIAIPGRCGIAIPGRCGRAIPGLCRENSLQDGRDPVPRHLLGMAKKHAAFALREHGIVGGAWATRSKIEPIRSRAHQLSVVWYIREHEAEGAVVWSAQRERSE